MQIAVLQVNREMSCLGKGHHKCQGQIVYQSTGQIENYIFIIMTPRHTMGKKLYSGRYFSLCRQPTLRQQK